MPVWKVFVPYAALVVLVALLMVCAAWMGRRTNRREGSEPQSSRSRFRVFVVIGGGILALARLAAFWLLLYREWTGTQERTFILLAVFLYPEGLALPREATWTVPGAVLFSGFLIVGSFLMAGLLAGMITLPQRLGRGRN